MRNGRWFILLGAILLPALLAAGLIIAASPPRGEPVELLPAPTAAPLWVQIDGAVSAPGLYRFDPGSRVADALKAAGGLAPSAAANRVNQAALLKDGDQIVVPEVGEELPVNQASEIAPAPLRFQPGQKIDLNTATLEELMQLPGIGETKAERVITYREAHSGFRSIDEIQEVEGIGPETFERLKDFLTIN